MCIRDSPRTLRNKLGFDLRQSLKTRNLKQAQKLRWKVVEKLKNKINDTRINSFDIKKKIKDFLTN